MLFKGDFKSYEPLWIIGDTIFQENNKIGFNIKYFCLNQLIHNKDKYTEEHTNTLIKMVQETQEIQKKMNPIDITCKQKEYQAYITAYFSNLERQRTNGVVTIELGQQYKLFSYLLEPLEQFNALNDKAKTIQTFCINTSKEIIQKCSVKSKGVNMNNRTESNKSDQSSLVNKVDYHSRQVNHLSNNESKYEQNLISSSSHLWTRSDYQATYNSNQYSISNNNGNDYISESNSDKDKEIDVQKEHNMPFSTTSHSKRKYVNNTTPIGGEVNGQLLSRNQFHNSFDSFPERMPAYKHQHSSKELFTSKPLFGKETFPSQYIKQTNFVKTNNNNAIDELKRENIVIAIQLIKNSINTLNTLPKIKNSLK